MWIAAPQHAAPPHHRYQEIVTKPQRPRLTASALAQLNSYCTPLGSRSVIAQDGSVAGTSHHTPKRQPTFPAPLPSPTTSSVSYSTASASVSADPIFRVPAPPPTIRRNSRNSGSYDVDFYSVTVSDGSRVLTGPSSTVLGIPQTQYKASPTLPQGDGGSLLLSRTNMGSKSCSRLERERERVDVPTSQSQQHAAALAPAKHSSKPKPSRSAPVPVPVPKRHRDSLHPDDAYVVFREREHRDSLDVLRGMYERARTERSSSSRLRHSSSSRRPNSASPPILKKKVRFLLADGEYAHPGTD